MDISPPNQKYNFFPWLEALFIPLDCFSVSC